VDFRDARILRMAEQAPIRPERITKPIQLLAAWLAGLTIVNGSFLLAATRVLQPTWIPATLVIASIANVPIFLFAIFLLQTKFRPEMQEDTFYAPYLASKTANTERLVAPEAVAVLREEIARIDKMLAVPAAAGQVVSLSVERIDWSTVTVSVNKSLGNFSAVVAALGKEGIPIHETFGGKNAPPDVFSIAVGPGFTVVQVKSLLDAASGITTGWISFAYEEPLSNYNRTVLVGAYGSYEYGMRISAMKRALRDDTTTAEMYKMLGEGKKEYRDDDED
jgi:hypothetical protein